jgi:hypothetical protein
MGKKSLAIHEIQVVPILVGIVYLDIIFHAEHNYCLHITERYLEYFFALTHMIVTMYLEE